MYITIEEARDITGVSLSSLRRFIKKQGIDGEKIKRDGETENSRCLIDRDFLLSFYSEKVTTQTATHGYSDDYSLATHFETLTEILKAEKVQNQKLQNQNIELQNTLIQQSQEIMALNLRLQEHLKLLEDKYIIDERRSVLIDSTSQNEKKDTKRKKFFGLF